MEQNRRLQEESLQRREELLREMEIGQQLTRRDQEEEEKRKEETRRELGGQVSQPSTATRGTRDCYENLNPLMGCRFIS